jgi:hypothetical protein
MLVTAVLLPIDAAGHDGSRGKPRPIPCADLKVLSLPDTTITLAESLPAGMNHAFTPRSRFTPAPAAPTMLRTSCVASRMAMSIIGITTTDKEDLSRNPGRLLPQHLAGDMTGMINSGSAARPRAAFVD